MKPQRQIFTLSIHYAVLGKSILSSTVTAFSYPIESPMKALFMMNEQFISLDYYLSAYAQAQCEKRKDLPGSHHSFGLG